MTESRILGGYNNCAGSARGVKAQGARIQQDEGLGKTLIHFRDHWPVEREGLSPGGEGMNRPL